MPQYRDNRKTARESLGQLSTELTPRQQGVCRDQNKKYLCAIGSTVAGSQVSNSPSARTS